jgi:hypothetical protein
MATYTLKLCLCKIVEEGEVDAIQDTDLSFQPDTSCSSSVKTRRNLSPVTDSEEFYKAALGRLTYDFHRREKERATQART